MRWMLGRVNAKKNHTIYQGFPHAWSCQMVKWGQFLFLVETDAYNFHVVLTQKHVDFKKSSESIDRDRDEHNISNGLFMQRTYNQVIVKPN